MIEESELKSVPPKLNHAYFSPWVGANYSLQTSRVMILGESTFRSDARPNYTIDCIQEIIADQGRYRFWTNIAIALLGRKPSRDETRNLWHSVAFHNYVQESVGDGPRIAPTDEMWKRDANLLAFREIVAVLKPKCVIVLGKRLWRRLPPTGSTGGPTIVGAPQPDTRIYSLDDGHRFLAYGIAHPSSGFSGWLWHPFVVKARQIADEVSS